MAALLIIIVIVPLVAGCLAFVVPTRLARLITFVSGLSCLALAVALGVGVHVGPVTFGFLRADALSWVFLVATAFVYATAVTYAIGYQSPASATSYQHRLFAGLNIFGWAMLCAPLVNGLALLWVAIEVTTVVSALLVAVDRTPRASEAAWKYVIIASAGLGIALFATILVYQAGTQVFGESYDLTLTQMIGAGSHLPVAPIRLAFLLAVLGFGTKVGLVPVHTWLPDAHTEAPTPVSAMLSGSLLAVSAYAVLRYVQICRPVLGAEFTGAVLMIFGVISLLVAAFSIMLQRDLKRLLAYSSIEHMGIVCLGISFGTPLALAGVLLHVLAHAAAKGNAFYGAGVVMHAYGTKDIDRIHGGLDVLPWTAPLFVCTIFALCGMPPFGMVRSEFMIIAGSVGSTTRIVAIVVLLGSTVAFLGLARVVTRTMFLTASVAGAVDAPSPRRGEPSAWMVAPMLAGLAVLVVLGLHPPAALTDLLSQAAGELM